MAEDVNFPLDQTRNTSTVEFLREALRESGRPRGIEDQEKEINNPDRFREVQKQQPVNDLGSLESRVNYSRESAHRLARTFEKPPMLRLWKPSLDRILVV